ELARVEGFIARAVAQRDDGKSRALLSAAQLILDRGRTGEGSGKLVIFTESLVTQEYLRELLSRRLRDEEITLFRGENESPRARLALERWLEEEGSKLPARARPSRDVAMRLALVHEFRTRSRVFIATEAGAKGLNLQFCETIVNYDLPWNPQRIEQRIGRCHRYGQERAVTVINFLAKDNEAARLTFEILSRKLDLFGTVLDASDVVLHKPGELAPEVLAGTLGTEVESSLGRIWQRARTLAEVEAELRHLRDVVGERRRRFEEEKDRTAQLIESAFDEEVRRAFVARRDELPAALAGLDADIEQVVAAHLEAAGIPFERTVGEDGVLLRIEASPALPEAVREGLTVAVGASVEHESLHLSHPLVVAAVDAARTGEAPAGSVAVAIALPDDAPAELSERRGRRGRLALLRVRYDGLEPVERLLPLALFAGDESPISAEASEALLACDLRDVPGAGTAVPNDLFEDVIEEALFTERARVTASEAARFDRGLEQVERYLDDRLHLARGERAALERRADEARARRDGALALSARAEADAALVAASEEIETLEVEIDRLERRDDDTYRRCRDRLLERRYAPATVTRIFDTELVLE
ncbi:MAG: hypothetical protein JNK60_03980, partial [Acidobacteria bacterium]|nr:hypothetical protein [Acidobacteriota bacterium]